MKKVIALLIVLVAINTSFAQAPQAFNYQGIARNSSGTALSNQNISVRASILHGIITGTVQYAETQTATTNQFGLFTISVGSGTVITGTLSAVTWTSGNKYLKIEFAPNGGTSYILSGTTQMLSVPYALYSANTGDTSMWKKNINDLFYNNGNVKIGTTNPFPQIPLNVVKDATINTVFASFDNGGLTQEGLFIRHTGSDGYHGLTNAITLDADFFGAGTYRDLALVTSNIARIVVQAGGNVGIGTTNPISALQVYGGVGVGTDNYQGLFGIKSWVLGSPQLFLYSTANTTGAPYAIQAARANLSNDAPLLINPTGGNVGIGTTSTPTSILQVVGLPVYANNAAAVAGGRTAGAFYRTGADPDVVCVVH